VIEVDEDSDGSRSKEGVDNVNNNVD